MQVDSAVMSVLAKSFVDGSKLVLPHQLDRKLYQDVNQVLVAAGGKWDRKAGGHLFDTEAADAIDAILNTGIVIRPQDFGYFPTPPALVARLIEIADLRPGMQVLEPSAGQGAIALCIPDGIAIDCVELQEKHADGLRALGCFRSVVTGDFLAMTPKPIYDRVIMNPPFTKRADVKHVLHAAEFVAPGGSLIAIMAAGVKYRQDMLTTKFRELLDEYGRVEDNPEGSFKLSGTSVNTVTVTLLIKD